MSTKKIVILGLVVVGVGLYFVSKDNNEFSQFRRTSSFSFKPTKPGSKREIASERKSAPETLEKTKKAAVIDNQIAYEKDVEIRSHKERYQKIASRREPDFLAESGSSYYLLEDTYAVPAIEGSPIPGAELKNNHYIVKGDRAPIDALKVVQNTQTGELAIFTGIVKVKLRDSSYVDEILNNYDCELEKSYGHIETYFFKFDDYEQTIEANRELMNAHYVLRSEVDVLEYSRKAR